MRACRTKATLVSKKVLVHIKTFHFAFDTLKLIFTVIATGTSTRGDTTYELVTFKLDTDYACEIFKSCKQESFIAQAGIESSIAFLDFLGVNGQNQSDSIITFELTKDDH